MAFKVLRYWGILAIILFQKIKKQVKPQEDGVRFYWISQEAVSRVLVIGSPPPEPPPNAYIF
jgi:CRISPR-associated protein Cas2